MYESWMDNTPIFGKIKDVYIEPTEIKGKHDKEND